MTRIITIILVVTAWLTAVAQRNADVDHTYRYVWDSNISIQQARFEAIQAARIDAISELFGTIVRQTTSSTESTIGDVTSSRFHLDASTVVRGCWVKDYQEPELTIDGEGRYIDVRIRGKIREYNNATTQFACEFLHDVGGKRKPTDTYIDGEQLWMSFSVPADGYLAVFSTDADVVTCALAAVRVEANKEYIFFEDGSYGELPIRMACSTPPEEYSQQYIIFSPNKFSLPSKGKALSQHLVEYQHSEFQKWLGNIRDRDNEAQVEVLPLTIRK